MRVVCKVDEEAFAIGNSTDFNINNQKQFTYTFWKKVKDIPNFYMEEGIDLLYISMFVFGADRLLNRKLAADSWSREIELFIPVLSYDKFISIQNDLERMLNFLSGDSWKLSFRKRGLTQKEKQVKAKMEKNQRDKRNYNTISMFSGGLDSFIGSIDLLQTQKVPLFVSHYGGGKGTREYQDILKTKLNQEYNIDEDNFMQFYAAVKEGDEDTTRTRSFMFFSHAIALATTMNQEVTLVIPENGLISLNIPLTYSRVGTSSTRTTHPFYMEQLQNILTKLDIKVKICNPYQFCTKGEMILQCKNKEFLYDNIKNTMSCSHPDNGRYIKQTEAAHCGYCLPCTIRLAAIKKSGITDSSYYYDKKYSKGKKAMEDFNTYKLAIEKFDPKYAFLKIQCSGPISESIKEYSDLYIRGMKELADYLGEYHV